MSVLNELMRSTLAIIRSGNFMNSSGATVNIADALGGSNQNVHDDSLIIPDGTIINTEVEVELTSPDVLKADALYAISIHNPSPVTDLSVECINTDTFSGVERNSLLKTYTVGKAVAGTRSTHTELVQGLFIGESSSLMVKNTTALAAGQVQTIDTGGTVTAGTFKLRLANALGINVDTDDLAYNISNANLKIAVDALIAEAGYVSDPLESAITVTVSGGALPTDAVLTFSDGGSTIVPTLVAISSLEGTNPTITVNQTTISAFQVDVKIRKV